MTVSYATRKAQAKRNARAMDRSIDAAVAEVHAQRVAEQEAWKAGAAERKAKAAAMTAAITDEQWQTARIVRDRWGWHRVVRINAKTATVETPWSWTDRIARARVLEVRTT